MFEVGHDILKHGFRGKYTNVSGVARIRIMHFVLLGAFVCFGLRTLFLGMQGVEKTRLDGADSSWVVDRTDILDRNGDILAKNVVSGDIYLQPRSLKNKDLAAQLIHDALPIKYSLNDALKLVNNAKRYTFLKRNATENEREMVKQARVAGVGVEETQTRRYPKRRLFSHVVGFVGRDGTGLSGAELVYDKYLKENKDPLQLSLDSRIQSVFYEQLSIAMQKYEAKAAMGMLMNSRTGEILAIVSLPDFDPENLNSDPAVNRFFKPMRGVYELGSIFKIFNTAMAFENGLDDRTYYIAEPFPIKDKFGRVVKKVSDVRSFKPDHPNFTVEEIMVHSCNVGSAQIALSLPEGTQQEFFSRLHFDKALDLEFGKTGRTLLPQKWGPVERATVSYGQGISVSPMHLLLAVNAVTNGGIYIYPTLLKRPVGVIEGERVLSEEISAKLRGIMYRVAEETSGRKARVAGIEIGGKTATAEKYTNGKVDFRRNLTSYVGIFPVNAPQYTILVILDEPKATQASSYVRTAAYNAVPTTGKILDAILPLLFE